MSFFAFLEFIPLSTTGSDPFWTGVGSLYPTSFRVSVKSSPKSMSVKEEISEGQSGPSSSTGIDAYSAKCSPGVIPCNC